MWYETPLQSSKHGKKRNEVTKMKKKLLKPIKITKDKKRKTTILTFDLTKRKK